MEFLGFESSTGTNKDTIKRVQAELAHTFTPQSLLGERACIGDGFTRMIRRLMRVDSWRYPIQKCCNDRLSLMDTIVQSLVHRTMTGHIEVRIVSLPLKLSLHPSYIVHKNYLNYWPSKQNSNSTQLFKFLLN